MISSKPLSYVAILTLGFAVGVLAHTWWISEDEDVDDLSVMDEKALHAAPEECKMVRPTDPTNLDFGCANGPENGQGKNCRPVRVRIACSYAVMLRWLPTKRL